MQQARRQALALDQLAHQGVDAGLLQLPRRHLDRQAQLLQAALAPLVQLRHGRLQRPLADGVDQARLFGQRDEALRVHQTLLGVHPSQQGPHAGDAARGQLQLRLVMQTKLAVGQGLLQLRAQARSALGVGIHARLVEAHGMASVLLGAVQGQVGQAQQGLGVGAVSREQAHPHAGRRAKLLAGQLQRLPQAGQQLIGQRHRIVRRQQRGQQHQELVAAQAGRHRLPFQRRAQALGHLAQQAIAGLMPQRVIELLEVVQVHEHHGQAPVACTRGVQALNQAIEDGRAVGQTGEPVVQRAVLGAVGLGTRIGHVDEGQQHIVAFGAGTGLHAHHPRVARVALPAHLTHGHAV